MQIKRDERRQKFYEGADWSDRREQNQAHVADDATARAVREYLLKIDGLAVEPLFIDDEAFVENAQLFDDHELQSVSGRKNDCHRNVATLCKDDGSRRIVTGYALSKDGLWRRHSWAVPEDEARLLETTTFRLRYAGCILNKQQRQAFLQEQFG